ncbi:MAG TPA: Sir2 family NAD-dependent protein deacetylase, partial [Lichenihabitans sp.]|nr:Sir2 family NAD-dependent protein deacetylase [Lichenihabitans sp.]
MARADRIVAFTGAGLSTECGVPDYRSPGSPWKVHAPIGFADYLADPALRREAWRRKFAMDDIYAGARPGRGHRALTRLYAGGRLGAVITQNIDGLQQAAGMPEHAVIELHGNGSYAACLECGIRFELAPIRQAFEADGTLPRCACGGIVKSASIAFGQPIPQDSIRRAASLAL